MILSPMISYEYFNVDLTRFLSLQHLLEYNDRPDLSHEDRDMLIDDLVLLATFEVY